MTRMVATLRGCSTALRITLGAVAATFTALVSFAYTGGPADAAGTGTVRFEVVDAATGEALPARIYDGPNGLVWDGATD